MGAAANENSFATRTGLASIDQETRQVVCRSCRRGDVTLRRVPRDPQDPPTALVEYECGCRERKARKRKSLIVPKRAKPGKKFDIRYNKPGLRAVIITGPSSHAKARAIKKAKASG